MSFDRAAFYASLRTSSLFAHGLSQRQVVGTEALLDAWDRSGFTDTRWLADILATSYHETGRAMYPVPEVGRGAGHPYGVAAANGQVYYGRGYVQLTWAANYQKADAALGLGDKLVANADLALDPSIAAQIIIRGMAEAWFTAFKLSDYLNAQQADFLHARRIVNGMDQAATIAGYAQIFLTAISAGVHIAGDTTVVAIQPAAPAAATQDPLSQIVSSIEETASGAAAAIPSILTGGPSPAAPEAPSATPQDSFNMNPFTAIALIQQVMTYAPTIEHIIQEIPDIEAKGEDAIAKFRQMDFAAAVTDIEGICADLGITQQTFATVIGHATASAPPAGAPASPVAAPISKAS